MKLMIAVNQVKLARSRKFWHLFLLNFWWLLQNYHSLFSFLTSTNSHEQISFSFASLFMHLFFITVILWFLNFILNCFLLFSWHSINIKYPFINKLTDKWTDLLLKKLIDKDYLLKYSKGDWVLGSFFTQFGNVLIFLSFVRGESHIA